MRDPLQHIVHYGEIAHLGNGHRRVIYVWASFYVWKREIWEMWSNPGTDETFTVSMYDSLDVVVDNTFGYAILWHRVR